MIYKKVLTETAFGQEARGSEAKGTAPQAEGTGYAKALRQGGARWEKNGGAGGAKTGMGTVVIRLLSTLSPKLQFCT